MTIPGAGGQVPPRVDQQYPGGQPVPVSPGGQPLARVTEIIVTPGGVLQGIFTYSSNPPAAGTLIETASVISAGVDKYGNNYLAGHSTYGAGFATSVQAGGVLFYTGSLSGGWTFQGQIEVSGGGILTLTDAAGILFADAATAGSSLTVQGALTAQSGASVSGGLSTDTLAVSGNANMNTTTINIANGNIDLNMASPPNYPTAGKTLAQTQACLDGLIGSMVNRQLVA